MEQRIVRDFNWASIVGCVLFDAERERVGRILSVDLTGELESRFIRVMMRPPELRTLLIAAVKVGIVGDGWVMLDYPLCKIIDPNPDDEWMLPGNGNEESQQALAGPPELIESMPCPLCGSVTHG